MALQGRASHNAATGPGKQSSIGWPRVRAIFNHPKPPRHVWERQFDGLNDELHRVAQTPYEQIDFRDLWYYHHDLAYVTLQPDLFDYLFPVCLMDWHDSLMHNKACSHGDQEFHYGVFQGHVFEKMITPARREAVYDFFRDSLLERIDTERRLMFSRRGALPCMFWLKRLNSLGIVAPVIERIWNAWWALDSPGRAVAALQYCSALMYHFQDNPLLDAEIKALADRTLPLGGFDNELLPSWGNDSWIGPVGWLPENVGFVRSTLSADFVNRGVASAVARLSGEPEYELARQLQADLPRAQELLASRIAELPLQLATGGSDGD